MSVTRCVGDFSRRLGKLPVTASAWRAELERLPETCENQCTPGGCRKHCREYATGAWVRASQSKPKGKKR